jgi:hypothetical protein
MAASLVPSCLWLVLERGKAYARRILNPLCSFPLFSAGIKKPEFPLLVLRFFSFVFKVTSHLLQESLKCFI